MFIYLQFYRMAVNGMAGFYFYFYYWSFATLGELETGGELVCAEFDIIGDDAAGDNDGEEIIGVAAAVWVDVETGASYTF